MLGFGLGLRSDHYDAILNAEPSALPNLNWFEIISENYMVPGGKPLYFLDQIRERFPLVMHGVSLSIGSTDPLNWEYLNGLKTLRDRISPQWVSDHLCWTGVSGINTHDLLPLPFNEETIQHVVARIKTVQDFLEQKIVLENISSYLNFEESVMSEWDFLKTIVEEADCNILLDINNLYVTGFNNGFDPIDYMTHLPKHRIQQFHLAGHTNKGAHLIDTHDEDIIDPVWTLYEEALKRFGPVATLIERDDKIPPLDETLKELVQAKKISDTVFSEKKETILTV